MDDKIVLVDKPAGMGLTCDEILLVDKPAGMSSFGVVARVRRKLTEQMRQKMASLTQKQGQVAAQPQGHAVSKRGQVAAQPQGHAVSKQVQIAAQPQGHAVSKRAEAPSRAPGYTMPKRVKVGHAGTLDPFATGLLILLVGKGTKRAGEFLKLDKEYLATIRLGAHSTTGDPEGIITELEVAEKPNKEAVEKAVENLVGENWQKVPAYSAVKINGQRAYKLARAGKEVEMPVRKVMIYEMELIDYAWPVVKVRCKVSSGTYIRALAEELGEKLGVGAYTEELRRTQIGEFRIEDAQALDT